MWQRNNWLLLTVAMLGTLASLQPVRAQDEPEPEPEVPQPGDLEDAMSDEQFEQWIFGRSLPTARKEFDSWLAKQIGQVDQTYRLRPDQKKKLELAGRAGMKRLFDRFETAREQLHRAHGDFTRLGPVLQELQSFQQAPHDYLFGDESLFAKTLRRTLTPAQIHDRAKTIYEARVQWMASHLDDALGLQPDQHRRLVSLIVEETSPLGRYGTLDYDAMMLQASRLPREKITSILGDTQVRKLVLRFEQARRMESILVKAGYVSANPTGSRQPAALHDPTNSKAGVDRIRRDLLLKAGREDRD